MVNERSHRTELTFQTLNEKCNGFTDSEESSGFYETEMHPNNMKSSYTSRYSDGLYLYVREPSRLYSYHYTCREITQQSFVSELSMYPMISSRKYVTAIHCYPVHNNRHREKPSFKQCVLIVPKNRQCLLSSRVLKEKQKIERHKCGLKFQPKQHTTVYTSSILLEPNETK